MDDRFALARKDPRYAEALTTPVPKPSIIRSLVGAVLSAGIGFVFYAITWPFGVMFWVGGALLLAQGLRYVALPVQRVLVIVDGGFSQTIGGARSEQVVHTVRFRHEDGRIASYYAEGGLSVQEPGTVGVAAVRGQTLLAFDPLS
jgi:hypothetical protein